MQQPQGLSFAADPAAFLAAWRRWENHLRHYHRVAPAEERPSVELRLRVAREVLQHLPSLKSVLDHAEPAPHSPPFVKLEALNNAVRDLHTIVAALRTDDHLHAATRSIFDKCLASFVTLYRNTLVPLCLARCATAGRTAPPPSDDLYHALPPPRDQHQ